MSRFEPFRHLAYARDLRARAPQPLKYTLSDSSCQSLTLADVMAMADSEALGQLNLGYSSIQGDAALREVIASLHKPVLDADNVVTFCGAQEAIYATMNHLLRPGDEVIVATPSYPSLSTLPSQLGATVNPIELSFDNGWQLTLDDFASRITTNTRLIVLNSPHNPTGAVIDAELASGIIELADKHGIYLLVDEVSVWSDFDNIGLQHPFLAYERTITTAVMSKSFGLPGIRIGWALSQDKALLQGLMDIRGYLSICVSTTDEQLALAALKNQQQILAANNALLAENVALFDAFVTKHSDKLQWHRPQCGIMSTVKTTMDINALAEALAMKHQLFILPAHLFGLPGNYFRLGLGRRDFAHSLAVFEQGLEA